MREFVPEIKEGIEQLSEAESKTYDLLIPRHEASAINIKDFSDLYGKEVIERDLRYVADKKQRIVEQGTTPSKRAKLLEALMNEQIESSNWLSQEASTFVTSEYDDFANGVDVAVEFERTEGFKHMALGVDVTSSSEAISKKLLTIREHILKGDLTRIKYFISEKSHIRGELGKIPQLIIGADSKLIKELSELWLTKTTRAKTNDISPETEKYQSDMRKEALKKLAGHRIQYLLLEELEMELTAFLEFAYKNNREDIANKYETLLDLIRSIKASKEDEPLSMADQSKNESDLVFKALKKELAEIFV